MRNAAPRAHDAGELYTLPASNIPDHDDRRRFVELAPTIDSMGPALSASGQHAAELRRASGSHPRMTSGGSVASNRPPLSTQPQEAPFIEHTTQQLAVFLGPIAKVVARKAADQARSRDEFLQLIASHMGTQDRQSFLRAVDSEDRSN